MVFCVFRMTNDAEHLFMWLSAICVSSVKGLLMSFGHFFFIELFAFLPVRCTGTFYILNASLFPGICVVTLFSQPVVCLFRKGSFNPLSLTMLPPSPSAGLPALPTPLDSLQSFSFLLCRSACSAPLSNLAQNSFGAQLKKKKKGQPSLERRHVSLPAPTPALSSSLPLSHAQPRPDPLLLHSIYSSISLPLLPIYLGPKINL